jgi:hypothetical protein
MSITTIYVKPAKKAQPIEIPLRYISKKELASGLLFIGTGILYPFTHPSYKYAALSFGLTSISLSLTPLREVVSRSARQVLLQLQLTLMAASTVMLGIAYWKISTT